MAQNIPTYYDNPSSRITRNGDYTGTPLTDVVGGGTYADPYLGMNAGGSNAPGIGIATAEVDPKVGDWTTLDQANAAREPQFSQHIGGSGLGNGDQVATSLLAVQGTDIDDQMSFSAATTNAADGQIYDSGTGAINKTGAAVSTGDRLWGPIPV